MCAQCALKGQRVKETRFIVNVHTDSCSMDNNDATQTRNKHMEHVNNNDDDDAQHKHTHNHNDNADDAINDDASSRAPAQYVSA